jgi:AAA family ATP:ADP antiporter
MTAVDRRVVAPAFVLFAILVAHSLLETARDALFLARLGPHLLAAAYVAMASAALLAIAAVRRWARLRDPRRVLIAFLAVAVAGTTAIAATIAASPSLAFVLYVWTGFIATLVVPSFWTAIDRSSAVGDAKRVFGAIGAGGVLGAMVGSAIAGVLGRLVPAHFLVTAGALAFALATVAAITLVPRTSIAEIPAKRAHVEGLSRKSRRYVRALLGFAIVSTFALTLGDLVFKRVIAERIDASELAVTFGVIYTGLNTIGLVIQLAVTPRLFARWGVGGALTVLPLILVASGFGFAMTGALVAVIALKLGDGGLRHSLHRVGSEILYVPVPSRVRDGGKLVADAIGQRGGQAIAALVVFATAALGATARDIAAIAAAGGVVWLVVLWFVRRAYVAQFRDTLQAGEIRRDVAIPSLDADAIALLSESVACPDEVEALAALDLLAHGSRIPPLVFFHPQPSVVRHALALLEGELPPETARVLSHLVEHADPKIRAAAIAASFRTGADRGRLANALADPHPEVRAAALVGLAGDGRRDIATAIDALALGSTAERLALAEAIGFAPTARFRRVLDDLLACGDAAVARQVLHVLARAPALAEPRRVLPFVADPQLRGDARRVFQALGRRGLDVLVGALDDPWTPLAVRRHLPRTISRLALPDAAKVLATRLPHESDGRTELKILRALGRLRADDPKLAIDPAPLLEYLRRAVRDAARYATFADAMRDERDGSPTVDLICEILVDKRRTAVERAFRTLGILHPRDGVRSAYDAFAIGDDARVGAAREILAAVAPSEIAGPLVAVVDDLTPDQRRARLGDFAPVAADRDALLAALLADPSESLRCVVAGYIAERKLVGLEPDLERMRTADGPSLVMRAFDQALESLHG